MDYIGCKEYVVHSVTDDGLNGIFRTVYLKEARNSAKRINNKGKFCYIAVYQCVYIEEFPVMEQSSIFDEVPRA